MLYMLNNPWHVVDTLQTLTEWIMNDWQWYSSLHQQLSSGYCNQMGLWAEGHVQSLGVEACMPCAAGEREMQQTLQLMV